jgi:hypothetical protein
MSLNLPGFLARFGDANLSSATEKSFHALDWQDFRLPM